MTKRNGLCRICGQSVAPLHLRCDACEKRYRWVRARLNSEVTNSRRPRRARPVPATPLEKRRVAAQWIAAKRTDPVYLEEERRKNRERMRCVRALDERLLVHRPAVA